MEQRKPDFMKNPSVVFYYRNSNDTHNTYVNSYNDKIVENRSNGRCTLYFGRPVRIVHDIRNFDKALDILLDQKGRRGNDEQ